MAKRLYQVGNLTRWYDEGSEPEGAVLVGAKKESEPEVKAVEPANKAKKPANKAKKAVSNK